MEAPQQNSVKGTLTQAAPRRKLVRTRKLTLENFVFYCALASIPFDNLFFAPSRGWATIAPIIFALYVGLNLGKLKAVRFNAKFVAVALGIIALQLLNVVIYGLHFDSLADAFLTIALGLFFYLALIIRYEGKEHLFDRDAKVLFWAYAVSFAYGVLWLLSSYFMTEMLNVLQFLEKRYYPRLAFTFTEPSFISMHVFGVLFLYSYFVSDRKMAKRLLWLGIAFVVLAAAMESGARIIADAGVFALLYLIHLTVRDRQHSARNLLLWILAIAAIVVVIMLSYRLRTILAQGLSVDGSGSTRLFKIQTMLYGFMHEPLSALFGFGFGNMIIPLRLGYDEALATYTSSYTREVVALGQVDEVSWMASMPVRFGAEIGVLAFLLATVLIFVAARRKRIDPFVVVMTLWLYIQFDSYAFYSIWMLLFLIRDYQPGKMGISYFELLTPRRKSFRIHGRRKERVVRR